MLDRHSATPLHQQLEEIIRQNIQDGTWPLGSAIPSENEFSRIYGMSRMTVRSVLIRLTDMGLLRRVPGKGTYVAEPKIESKPLSQMGIREQLDQMGLPSRTALLSVAVKPASRHMAELLGLEPEEPLYEVDRMRSVEEEPFSLHKSFLPLRFFPDIEKCDLEGKQLCHILETDYHFPITKRVETLESVTASPSESEILHVSSTFPLLLFETVTYTQNGQGEIPIECSRVVFRGDRIKLTFTYQKGANV